MFLHGRFFLCGVRNLSNYLCIGLCKNYLMNSKKCLVSLVFEIIILIYFWLYLVYCRISNDLERITERKILCLMTNYTKNHLNITKIHLER